MRGQVHIASPVTQPHGGCYSFSMIQEMLPNQQSVSHPSSRLLDGFVTLSNRTASGSPILHSPVTGSATGKGRDLTTASRLSPREIDRTHSSAATPRTRYEC
jgi:hypothetical protein